MYNNMSWEDWNTAIEPKVRGSWNLHDLLPRGLYFFIMTSSISGILGQATQINYAAGNAYQDALAKHRIASGEKGVSLDLGLLEIGGLWSQRQDLRDRLTNAGYLIPVSETQILALFNHFCNPNLNLQHPSQAQVIVGIKRPADIIANGTELLDSMRQPFWSQELTTPSQSSLTDTTTILSSSDDDEESHLLARLQKAASSSASVTNETPTTIITRALVQRFSRMLSIPESNINVEEPLHVNGADSLSAVDLRNWIAKRLGVEVAVFDILGEVSIRGLGEIVAGRWKDGQRGGRGVGKGI